MQKQPAADRRCVPASISAPALKEGRLVTLPFEPLAADEGYYLASRPSGQPEARDAFVDWIRLEVAGMHGSA